MKVNLINRPWHKGTGSYGSRVSKDPFYQSTEWKRTKAAFKQGFSLLPNGNPISNTLCYECMASLNKVTPMHTVDHVTAIKDGGDRTDFNNLKSLCLKCHNKKSAHEGNERRRREG